MLTAEENDRLTRVGPGTPMGNLLRRYWHPISTVAELGEEPVLAVRVLGEDLALYRNDRGEIGLIASRCAHRGASLAYGIPELNGIRCPYHGWLYDRSGACIEQPSETALLPLRLSAYPVQEMGGLIFAYLGPSPAPELPRWDLMVRDDLERDIGISRLPCNWLQIMENSLDPVHLEYLHSNYMNHVMKRLGKPPVATSRHHVKLGFDVFEHGIVKRRLLEGQPEDVDDWQIGHPILFPNMLAVGNTGRPTVQIRVPVDDTHTLHYWYNTNPRSADAEPQASIPTWKFPYKHDDGRIIVETVFNQDMMAWVTQGEISDRTDEHLVTADKGVMLYRKMLLEQIEKVERGENPFGVIRDPSLNTPMIEIRREVKAHYSGDFIGGNDQNEVRYVRGETVGAGSTSKV